MTYYYLRKIGNTYGLYQQRPGHPAFSIRFVPPDELPADVRARLDAGEQVAWQP